MDLKRFVIFLLSGFPFLLVGLAVFAGGFAFASASGDEFGTKLMWWVTMFDLMFLVIDVVLLVPLLAIYVLSDDPRTGLRDDQGNPDR